MKTITIFAKHALVNFILGAVFIVAQLLWFYYVGNAIHYQLKGTWTDLATSFGAGSISLFGLAMFGVLMTGFLIYVMAWVKYGLNSLFHLGNTKEPSFSHEGAAAIIITILTLGIITSFIFSGFHEFVSNINPNVNLASLNSLYNALSTGQYTIAVIIYFVIVIMGALVAVVASMIQTIENKLPKALHK